MEALNISQLPQWKQDQIVIAGLTKRVEELLGQLEEQARNHKEDTLTLRQENRRLLKNQEILCDQLRLLPAFVQTLVETQASNSTLMGYLTLSFYVIRDNNYAAITKSGNTSRTPHCSMRIFPISRLLTVVYARRLCATR